MPQAKGKPWFTLGDPNDPSFSIGPFNWPGLINTTPTPGVGLPDISVGPVNWEGLLNVTPQGPPSADERSLLQRLLNIGTPGGPMMTQQFPQSDLMGPAPDLGGLPPDFVMPAGPQATQQFPLGGAGGNEDLHLLEDALTGQVTPGDQMYTPRQTDMGKVWQTVKDFWNYPLWNDGEAGSEENGPVAQDDLAGRLARIAAERSNMRFGFGGEHSMSFPGGSIGTPDMYRQDVAMPTAPGSGVAAMQKWLHSPQRVARAVADPTDYGVADEAFAAAAPKQDSDESLLLGWLGGLGQAMARGGYESNGDMLLALGGGTLAGIIGAMGRNRERGDEYQDQMSEYNLKKAGYEGEKASGRRAEQQQQYDAAYEADTNYETAQRAYGAELGRQAV